MSAHAVKVDRSGQSGDVVVCECGFAGGPYLEAGKARDVAAEHRAAHQPPRVSTPESRAIANEKARLGRLARKQAAEA